MRVSFVVPGVATAQGRPRFRTIKTKERQFTSTYDPKKSREYKTVVRFAAEEAMKAREPFQGAVSVWIVEKRLWPKSMSMKKRMIGARPITKPDVENIAKGVLDAMNGIVYGDDKQVVYLSVSKFYSGKAQLEVDVEEYAKSDIVLDILGHEATGRVGPPPQMV